MDSSESNFLTSPAVEDGQRDKNSVSERGCQLFRDNPARPLTREAKAAQKIHITLPGEQRRRALSYSKAGEMARLAFERRWPLPQCRERIPASQAHTFEHHSTPKALCTLEACAPRTSQRL